MIFRLRVEREDRGKSDISRRVNNAWPKLGFNIDKFSSSSCCLSKQEAMKFSYTLPEVLLTFYFGPESSPNKQWRILNNWKWNKNPPQLRKLDNAEFPVSLSASKHVTVESERFCGETRETSLRKLYSSWNHGRVNSFQTQYFHSSSFVSLPKAYPQQRRT